VPRPEPALELRTERLLLRPWREEDRDPFAALNADPEVMEHFPAPLDRAESDAFIDRMQARLGQRGFGFLALERLDRPGCLGFVGLSVPRFEAAFTPCVEVGWRLARSAWGHGYATEAAHAALDDGFGRVGLTEIVSFTAEINERSQAVMRRLGLTHDPAEDFDHPSLPPGHRLSRHVLYRIRRPLP
jgi:RimJ/RimL family protein N-acetyltransferase